MKIKNIIERAKELGICKEWAEKMEQNPSVEGFCNMFFKGSDWATEHDFPTPEMLRAFPEVERYGLYLDKTYQGRLTEKMAFFGSSDVEIVANNFDVAEIYLRHNSRLNIRAKNYAKIFVYQYDNAKVRVVTSDNAEVKIFNYKKKENGSNI